MCIALYSVHTLWLTESRSVTIEHEIYFGIWYTETDGRLQIRESRFSSKNSIYLFVMETEYQKRTTKYQILYYKLDLRFKLNKYN